MAAISLGAAPSHNNCLTQLCNGYYVLGLSLVLTFWRQARCVSVRRICKLHASSIFELCCATLRQVYTASAQTVAGLSLTYEVPGRKLIDLAALLLGLRPLRVHEHSSQTGRVQAPSQGGKHLVYPTELLTLDAKGRRGRCSQMRVRSSCLHGLAGAHRN